MKNVTIISHLTPEEWKMSWKDKVVEDNRENMNAYRQIDCFWGHFTSDSDFTICHHKEFEIKGMSLSQYFTGHLEVDERGSRITGKFGKKLSANMLLAIGGVFCIIAFISAWVKMDIEVSVTSAVLLAIILAVYFAKPKKGQDKILKHLEKISFDSKFHHREKLRKPEKKRKKRTMKEKASVKIESEQTDEQEQTEEQGKTEE